MPSQSHLWRGVVMFLLLIFNYNLNGQHPKQQEIDSLLAVVELDVADSTIFKSYRQLFNLHFRRDIAKAKEYLDKEVSIAQKTGVQNNIILAKVHEGIYYSITRNNSKALELFTEAKEYYEKVGDRKKVGSSLLNISSVQLDLGNHKQALESQMESLKICEEFGETGISLGKNYYTIGNIHRMSRNLSIANEWFKKALIEYEKAGSEMYASQVYFTLGTNYLRIDSLDKAEPMLIKATNYFRKVNNSNALSILLSGLGMCSISKNDYDKALELYLESLDLTRQVGDFNREMDISSKLGHLHYLRKEYPQSIKYQKFSLAKAREFGLRGNELEYLKDLGNALGANEDYREAYQTLKTYDILNDSIQKEDNLAALSEIETKYQTEKKEQEIILLEEKDKRSSLEKKVMFAGIIGLILLFGLLFYAMRQKVTKNKLAKAKVDQELEYSQKELDLKKQELTAYALQLAHKNEVLEDIKTNVSNAQNQKDNNRSLQQVINKIDFNQNDDESWDGFRSRFLAVHVDFESKVKEKFPSVSANELRLMALLKMNLSSKEIANILNISGEGIKKARYRLRKKLSLSTGASLEEMVLSI